MRARDAVAGDHQRPLRRRSIGEAAGDDLEATVDGLGRALDDAERGRARTEDACEEEREEWIDRFGGRVGGEADPAEEPDRTGEHG